MKQFLVPALLLVLVGVSAAIAAGRPPVAAPASSESHGALVCPTMSGSHGISVGGDHGALGGASHCPSMGSESCPSASESQPAAATEECVKKCEEFQEPECCKKKHECSEKPAPQTEDKP